MPTLVAAYEHATGAKLTVSYGSSATLEQQLENGAPQDIFLAADYSFPEKLVAAKLTDETAPIAYARGTLVLWARKDSPLQPLTNNTLEDPRIQKLAIANEAHAPYGRAAMAALAKLNLLPKLKDKLVIAENVSGAAQFAESGNAQGAFRLARTYDTAYLPAADAASLANRNEARVWYGRAASLGDREAAARLKDLGEGR